MTDREFRESMTQHMAELLRHIAEVRKSNSAIQSEIKEMRIDLTALRQDVDTLRQDVDALRKDVDTVRKDVDALRRDVDLLRQNVDAQTNALGDKFSHFLSSIAKEIAHERARLDEAIYDDVNIRKLYDERLTSIESRLDRLEASPT